MARKLWEYPTMIRCERCQHGQLYVAAGEDDLMMWVECPDCLGRGFFDPMLHGLPPGYEEPHPNE